MNIQNVNIYLAGIFLLCTLTGLLIGLSHDESYYWVYSLGFNWGHYDHPPMVGWMIKMGTFLWGKSDFGVRFFFSVFQVVSIYELFKLAKGKSPIVLVLSVFIFPMLFSAGFLALPDTPSLLFSILFIKYYIRFLDKNNFRSAMVLAIVIALLFYSKYHGVLIVFFSILAFPKVVLRKHFWTVFLISLVLFMPHLYWQYTHEFETFQYHLFKRKQRVFEVGNIINYIGSQIVAGGLFAFPIIVMAILKRSNSTLERVLKFNIWGLFAFLLFSSLRNKIEANWTITSWAFAAILLQNYLANESEKKRKFFYYLSIPSLLIIFSFWLSLLLPETITKSVDRLAEFKNWKEKARVILSSCESDKVIANTYQMGAKLNFYSDIKIPVQHYQVRASEFLHVEDFPVYNLDDDICFITYEDKYPNSVKIEIGFPEFVYVVRKIKLRNIIGPKSEN